MRGAPNREIRQTVFCAAVAAISAPNPPAWCERIIGFHHRYWPDEAAMADGNPMLILERGEKVMVPVRETKAPELGALRPGQKAYELTRWAGYERALIIEIEDGKHVRDVRMFDWDECSSGSPFSIDCR